MVEPLRHPLAAVFAPRTVAVIGATDRAASVGRTVLWNVVAGGFQGHVYPVNPRHQALLGLKCYPSVGAIGERVDLAVVVTPAQTVPAVIEACASAGVRAAVIVSSGFRETGKAGQALERELLEHAHGRTRIVGPNCLGVISSAARLNASLASAMPLPGNVAFVSQSGALCTAILDWSLRERVGFSHFISAGSMVDVDWGDLIEYLRDDEQTKSIVMYMESVGDARSFLSAARETALVKPIIVLKAGRSEAAARAAISHTGAISSSDEVVDAAFWRSGLLRVRTVAELFYVADVLANQPRPRGKHLAIVTNAGGPGVLATDELTEGGGELATLSKETLHKLDELLPAHWSHGNPVDVLGDADAQRFSRAVELVAADPACEGVLAILAPQAVASATTIAEQVKASAHLAHKPIFANWFGGMDVAAGAETLKRAGIPTFAYPDSAARVFNYLWRYDANLRALFETPGPEGDFTPRRDVAAGCLAAAQAQGRTLLDEAESKRLIEAYGIPVVATSVAATADEAVSFARQTGFPVVLKLRSSTVAHKAAVGGVRLGLRDEGEVRHAWLELEAAARRLGGPRAFEGATVQELVDPDGLELIIGAKVDAQFGPVVLFGAGGRLVEVLGDRALALPPLSETLALLAMQRTRIYSALKALGDGSAPARVARVLVRFSALVMEQPRIAELDVNPFFVSAQRLLALDARVVLHPPSLADDALPRPAIRPYPSQYSGRFTLRNGGAGQIRAIRPDDEPMMRHFHGTLTEHSAYMRYASITRTSDRVEHEHLSRLCFIDYQRQLALVAVLEHAGERSIIAVANLLLDRVADEAEFAITISDHYQRHGLGTELLKRLVDVGRAEKIGKIVGHILHENEGMLQVSRRCGFKFKRLMGDFFTTATLTLSPATTG